MTPLAQQIVRSQIGAVQKVVPELERSDCRCFEVSAVIDVVHSLGMNEKWIGGDEAAFLPAPCTWIEWRQAPEAAVQRCGILLVSYAAGERFDLGGGDGNAVRQHPGYFMTWFARRRDDKPGVFRQWRGVGFSCGEGGEQKMLMPDDMRHEDEVRKIAAAQGRFSLAALALINTPHIFRQRMHQPHVGLQREIARSRKTAGRAPLQAWTEITLDLTPPKEAQDAGHEAHLTGGRALHFCRAHLRVRLGRVEFVRHHWRGDASIGIRQSRYVVKPPRAA